MRVTNKIVALFLLPAFLLSSPALAQQARVVDAVTLEQALATQAGLEQNQRELVRRVLDRTDARQLASQMGLSVQQADSAITALSGAELNSLAQHAGAVETALAGGASAVVISTTTLLLVLIIVILLVK